MVIAGYETIRWVDFRWQMPGDESAMAVSVRLGEGIAEGDLSSEIHVSEEKLANQVGRYRALLAFVLLEHVLYAPVEKPYAEGAEMVVWREQGC